MIKWDHQGRERQNLMKTIEFILIFIASGGHLTAQRCSLVAKEPAKKKV